jgi:hypothetical protein
MSHHSRHNKTHDTHTPTPTTSAPMANDKSCAAESAAGRSQAATDRIRVRAYELSKARNGGPGDALADWTQAEREVAAGRNA